MSFIIQPGHVLVLAIASIINREQQLPIDYLKAENRVLNEQVKAVGGRIPSTDK